MDDPDSILMDEPLSKLRDLRSIYPNARGGDVTYLFAAYFADPESEYFDDGDRILPEEFMITWAQAMKDVAAGENSFNGERVPSEMTMLGMTIETEVTLDTEGISRVVFPQHFADAVSEMMAYARLME